MTTVLLKAPLLTRSGYGVHARQIARWLFSQPNIDITCECVPWGVTPWLTDIYAEDGLIGEILEASKNVKPFYDVSVQLQLPNEWNPFIAGYNVGVTAGVETDKCHPDWVNCVNRMQKVIVPSEFTKQTFLNTGKVATPIEVIPESFPDIMALSTSQILPLDLKTDFNFLIVGQLTGNNPDNDRKGTLYALKWFAEAFAGNPDVGLVVKTSMFRQTHLDRKLTSDMFTKLLTENKLQTPNGPKFYLLHGDMTDEEMSLLYTHPKIKALLALTHGEGFGLPILEAGVRGLPVIATNWSAHTEFLVPKKWLSVSQEVKDIHPSRIDNTIFMPGVKWAYPDEQDAKRRMLKFYENSSLPRQWAREMSVSLKQSHSFKSIAEKYTESFKGVLS